MRDDTEATPNVAVVNEAFVRRFFKDQNPIGQHFGPEPAEDTPLRMRLSVW